jgi:cytidylate kinase
MHIAICGELGAGCTEVGQTVSKKLGLRCINSGQIIRGIISNFRGVHPDESFEEFEKHVRSGEVNLDRMISGKIDELIEEGDMIVEGRSAFMLLNKENVFKILLVAPLDKRVEHIARRRNITADEAREQIQESDSERSHMVDRLFKRKWLEPHNYDMVINTGVRSYEETANLIVKALQMRIP